jgi:hypothetical protein
MSYKYRKIPSDKEVVYAEVIAPAIWNNGGNAIYSASTPNDKLPVGAITWFGMGYISTDSNGNMYLDPDASVCPENNRYGWNFDPSCFELLHTSIKKIK